jgi:class 3 adenylate cyclase
MMTIAAARQMYYSLENLNARWSTQSIPRVPFRCGIHQGEAVVRMFGSSERSDYSAMGANVNLAARIQESAEPSSILVSAAVANHLNFEETTT